ncbi:MAG: ABC transporter ATP-binding protein [Anaerolineaceae bacterium]|nr:ABC transporter ATP-binding protein [Anaerolineaceae bacterium]
MSNIVFFQDITKRFGEVTALKDITLGVEQGEFLSLLGPSGCGKTTLLRCCAGLETPNEGRVFVEEKDVTDLPAYKRPVNMVFQRWALFPHKTVSENIAFGLTLKKVSKTEINKQVRIMLDLVKMEGYEDRFPKQLSGGQTQRIALARALIMQPRVLLLDEPLGSLDLKLRKEMQIELINIHKRLETTFIYVTHDQEEALTMSNRVVLMNEGMIIQDGTPSEVYQKPKTVFAAQFIGEGIFFKGKVNSIHDNICQVQSGNFLFRGIATPGVNPSQEVTVCVRPERVQINCVPGTGGENQVDGQIVNTIFKGPAVHYQVQITDGKIITVQQNLEQDIPLYTSQSTLILSWQAESCIVLAT